MKVKSKVSRGKRKAYKVPNVCLPEEYPWLVLTKLMLDLKEYLTESDYSKIEEVVRKRDFDGYLDLAEAWGLQSISSTDADVVEIRSKYLLASLIKKFQFPSDLETRIARATDIFVEAESMCKSFNEFGYKELAEPETEFGVELLHYARLFLSRLLGDPPGHLEMLDRSRHGPGATIGTKNGNISQYHKFAEWPYSCTEGALRYAQFAIATDHRWIGALQDSYRSRFGIKKHMPIDMDVFWSRVIKVVPGNRITFVPKDARKERTIAIEPTMNLYLQLGIDGYIRKRLKRWGVDLDNQEKNQKLAFQGSLRDDDQSYVTIDLSAASDTLSTKVCEILLPDYWYKHLMSLRSPLGILGNDTVSYEKISSMGNGYTFALESAIFAALVYAVSRAGGGQFNRGEFAVFGDDIIVRKPLFFKMVEALRLAGFRTNLEKTFSNGPIRESCGTDWFHGLPLRPVFLDRTPSDVMELFCDYNRIKRLLSLRWGLETSNCLKLIEKWVPERARKLIGPFSDEEFDGYMHVSNPVTGMYQHGMYRYDRLVKRPRPQKGNQFLFRKLMHDLRGERLPEPFWDKVSKARGKGSRFTVTSRNSLTVGKTFSVSSIWRSEYRE